MVLRYDLLSLSLILLHYVTLFYIMPLAFSCQVQLLHLFDSYKLLQQPIYPPERQHTSSNTPRFPHYTSALTGAESTDQFPFCFNSLLKAIPKGTKQRWLLEVSMLNHPARMNRHLEATKQTLCAWQFLSLSK